MNDLHKLEWDSAFFEKNVFSLKSSSISLIGKTIESLPKNSLLYVFSDVEIFEYADFLVDKKVTYDILLTAIDIPSLPYECILYSKKPFSRVELDLLAVEASILKPVEFSSANC